MLYSKRLIYVTFPLHKLFLLKNITIVVITVEKKLKNSVMIKKHGKNKN